MAYAKQNFVDGQVLTHTHLNNIEDGIVNIWDVIYPVGSIYMSVNSTSPASLFGGTWTQLKDRFLLGAGATYSNGNTGGEATHTLTINEMPKHDHDVGTYHGGVADSGGVQRGYGGDTAYKNIDALTYTGGGAAHNNMPPYLVVYMWKRTA